jgi:hypothetical protein
MRARPVVFVMWIELDRLFLNQALRRHRFDIPSDFMRACVIVHKCQGLSSSSWLHTNYYYVVTTYAVGPIRRAMGMHHDIREAVLPRSFHYQHASCPGLIRWYTTKTKTRYSQHRIGCQSTPLESPIDRNGAGKGSIRHNGWGQWMSPKRSADREVGGMTAVLSSFE